MKIIATILVTLIYITKGYIWQLPFFDCRTPNLDPYDDKYDCLQREVYFMHSDISDLGLTFGLYMLGKGTRIQALTTTVFALSFGGFMDLILGTPNNNLTVIAVCAAVIHLAFTYGRRKEIY